MDACPALNSVAYLFVRADLVWLEPFEPIVYPVGKCIATQMSEIAVLFFFLNLHDFMAIWLCDSICWKGASSAVFDSDLPSQLITAIQMSWFFSFYFYTYKICCNVASSQEQSVQPCQGWRFLSSRSEKFITMWFVYIRHMVVEPHNAMPFSSLESSSAAAVSRHP